MLKLIKLFSWIKGHWKLLLGIISIFITVYAGIQTHRANRAEREQLRLEGKLEEQMSNQDKLFDEAAAARTKRAKERAEERLRRKELEARIQKFKKESEEAKRALEREKEKTAKLPPTELVAEIVERIGFESDLTKSGLYLFTRKGAERTLDRFKDGEFYLSEYSKFQEVIAAHDAEVKSFNESIAECEEEKEGNFAGWEDCRKTLATAIKDKEAIKKAARLSKWRARGEGAVGGALFIFVIDKIFEIF